MKILMSNPLNLGQVGAGRPYGHLHEYLQAQGKKGRIDYRFISGASHVRRLYGNVSPPNESLEQGAMSDQLISFDESLKCDVFLGCGCASVAQLDFIRNSKSSPNNGAKLITSWFSTHFSNASRVLREESEKVGINNPLPVDPFLCWRDEKEHDMSDILLVPSAECARTYEEHPACKGKTRVVQFGVDSGLYHPSNKPPLTDFRVLFVGGNWVRKGLPYLIRAWNGLKLKDAVLTTAGCQFPPVQVHRHVDMGWVKTESDLAEVYRKNQVFVLPTLEEGSALAVYESMASGCAVVTTKEAGSPITDGKDGIIISSGSVEQIAGALLDLYEHPGKVKELGAAARQTAESLTWERFGESVLKVCEEAAK